VSAHPAATSLPPALSEPFSSRLPHSWHYYDGDGPIVLYLFNFTSGAVQQTSLGRLDASAHAGHTLMAQFTVPGSTWVGALLATNTSWAFTGAQTTPAFDPRDSTMVAGNDKLLHQFYEGFPSYRALIHRLTSF